MKRGQSPKGKKFEVKNNFERVKFLAETVDSKNLKTVNFDIRFWYEKYQGVNHENYLHGLFKDCKKVLGLKKQNFYDRDKIINIKNLPRDIYSPAPKAFIIFEFTLFMTTNDIEEFVLVDFLNDLCEDIYDTVFKEHQPISKSK